MTDPLLKLNKEVNLMIFYIFHLAMADTLKNISAFPERAVAWAINSLAEEGENCDELKTALNKLV